MAVEGPCLHLDAASLTEAFPAALAAEAGRAGTWVSRRIDGMYGTTRFPVRVESQTVLIPSRLLFTTDGADLPDFGGVADAMVRSLQSRSTDGRQRQHAARDLLVAIQPWSAPFVVALLGEYVIEILSDIEAAMTPTLCRALVTFAAENPDYWFLTKQRVTSYRSEYYPYVRRSDHPGFRIVERIEDECRTIAGPRNRPGTRASREPVMRIDLSSDGPTSCFQGKVGGGAS